jgi:hypothetical protein
MSAELACARAVKILKCFPADLHLSFQLTACTSFASAFQIIRVLMEKISSWLTETLEGKVDTKLQH